VLLPPVSFLASRSYEIPSGKRRVGSIFHTPEQLTGTMIKIRGPPPILWHGGARGAIAGPAGSGKACCLMRALGG